MIDQSLSDSWGASTPLHEANCINVQRVLKGAINEI